MLSKSNKNKSVSHNQIAESTVIKGEVKGDGNYRIDGVLEGNITTFGKIVIGDSGKIIGNIKCSDIDIYGMVDGKIDVKNEMSIGAKATIKGEVVVSKISIENGAIFNAKCTMKNSNSSK